MMTGAPAITNVKGTSAAPKASGARAKCAKTGAMTLGIDAEANTHAIASGACNAFKTIVSGADSESGLDRVSQADGDF